MWLWLALGSALLLGVYDVAKKRALQYNSVYWILLCATALTTLFLSPFLSARPIADHYPLMFKAVLVSVSWISGLKAMECLPLTTVSTIKASRPMFVVIFSILIFGERLNLVQWLGVAVVMTALFLSSRSSHHDTDKMTSAKGVLYMAFSVLSGAASALWDKMILQRLEPLFVQSWTNLYITILLALVLLLQYLVKRDHFKPLTWDWRLLLIAVLITVSDALYFFAVKQPDALLSIISTIRRSSVIVTFLGGVLILKEGHVRDKALVLVLMIGGVALLLSGSA
jgi:transporter family protein